MIDGEVPCGWSGNPSRWSARVPVLCMALVGFAIATYLALYQWNVLTKVWEPFFGEGSREVLHSNFSRALPIPDAALGAIGYLVDFVAGLLGGKRRWRTRPYLVLSFGVIVFVMATVSLFLILAQAFVIGSWCTLCLCSAAVSLMIPFLAVKEVEASWKYVRNSKERNDI